jgi:hypothetical protein
MNENIDGLKILGFRHELEIIEIATGRVVEREVKLNRIPQAGIDFLIQAPFGDVPPVATWYCALFRNNVLPDANTSAADLPSVLGEFVDYSEATRPLFVRAYNSAGLMDNAASKAIFTPTADRSIYGSVIVSNPVKGSNTGLVLSAVRFSTVKQVSAGLEAKLVCGLTYIPTNVI